MMIKVDKSELLKAMDKAAVRCKDSFIFTITNRKDNQGKQYASVSASDGTTQAMISFMVTSEEVKRFIVGTEVLDVLKAVGEFDNEYTIDVTETTVTVSAGSASMPIGIKPDGTLIQMQSPKDPENTPIVASFERETFIKALKQGSFAFASGTGYDVALTNTVGLCPVTAEDKTDLIFISSDGKFATRSRATALEADDNFKATDNSISVDAPALRSICSRLENESIKLMIMSKQVIIKDGNDFYAILRYETKFPAMIGKFLDKSEYSYKAELDVATFKAALKVATILEQKAEKKAMISLKNGQATVSSVLGTNKADIKAENIEGEIDVVVNAKDIEVALADLSSEKITIFGEGETMPVYLYREGVKVLTMPVKKTNN